MAEEPDDPVVDEEGEVVPPPVLPQPDFRQIVQAEVEKHLRRLSGFFTFNSGRSQGGEHLRPRMQDGITSWRNIGGSKKAEYEPEPIGTQPCVRCGLAVMVWRLPGGEYVEAIPGAPDHTAVHKCISWHNNPI